MNDVTLRQRDIGTGSVRDVTTVAGPLVVSMLSYTVMGLADALLVARLGKTEVAAVGLATAATFTLVCFGLGLLRSVKIAVAQAYGADDPGEARRLAWHGLGIAALVGIGVLCLIPAAPGLATLLGGSSAVRPLAAEYFAIRLWGGLPLFIAVAGFGYFEGQGDTRTPMRINVAANLLNVVLDLVLIFGWGPIPALGVGGAALATVISQCVQGGAALWLVLGRLKDTRPAWSGRRLRRLLDLGLPMGTQWALEVASWAVFAGIVARAGDAHLAAHTIVVRIVSVSFLPGHAIGEATSILTGQAVGARNGALALRSAGSATLLCLGLMGVLGPVFLFGGEWLVGFFRSDPEVLQVGGTLMILAALFQFFDAVAVTRSGALNGVGDTRFVMIASVGLAWAVLVPAAWLLAVHLGLGAPGAWAALALHISLMALVMWLRWRTRRPLRFALARVG